jgi:hypothetical protein
LRAFLRQNLNRGIQNGGNEFTGASLLALALLTISPSVLTLIGAISLFSFICADLTSFLFIISNVCGISVPMSS